MKKNIIILLCFIIGLSVIYIRENTNDTDESQNEYIADVRPTQVDICNPSSESIKENINASDLESLYNEISIVENADNFMGEWHSIEQEGTHSGDIKITNQTSKGFKFDGTFYYHHGGISNTEDAPNIGDASGNAYFVNENLAICNNIKDVDCAELTNGYDGYAVFYIYDNQLHICTDGVVGLMGGNVTMDGVYSKD
ncbi:hypothetical protein [Pseudobutyrivibrio sp.]|uniref:hypothetical protein n=1 Tax=Pseudobutyrivibrio sp. TaxID=2014367 RepID=UPI001DFC0927|nr:hypothetical protein [Pseudobutyrivibrio sp.]MBE5911017.1 hypothetical protein [Pseudobutyrivibrio sp.]